MAEPESPYDVEAPPPAYPSTSYPPSYDSIPNDQPPTYDSLYGRVKAAKASSDSHVGFFQQLAGIVASTIGCSVGLAFVLAVPIAMIVIGAIYLNDCQAQHYIPIYLIVAGVFGALRSLSSLAQRVRNRVNERDDENVKTNPGDGLVGLFLLIWFIVGNVWIYGTFKHFQSDTPGAADYCNYTLYWFSFWITTSTYIIMAFTCCCICCVGCLASLVQ